MNAKAKKKKRQRERAKAKEKKSLPAESKHIDLATDSSPPNSQANHSAKGFSSSESSPLKGLEKSNESYTQRSYSLPSNGKKYFTPENGPEFDRLVKEQYDGFVHVSANEVTPSNFHQRAKSALERLRDSNYYQYDVVMAGGKHSSRTFVKRTLVGNPGITYKYLGLRLFAHSWSGPGTPPLLKAIGDLNQDMIRMTLKHKTKKRQRQGNHGNEQSNTHQEDVKGSCEYNLTLINYMEPSSHTKIGFKDEAFYGMGKVSVSWHADSSLEPYSSIGVYHCLPTQRKAKWDWRIALRRSPDGNDSSGDNNNESNIEHQSVPPIVLPTKDGDVYFLNGTFNHTHQHCVLAGSEATRISSTHRVAVTKEDTYEYISKRVRRALKRFKEQFETEDLNRLSPVEIVKCQKTLTEVEMEWIAQYWLQGSQHDSMHIWWQQPMKKLEAQWVSLEELTFKLYRECLENIPSEKVKPNEKHVVPRDVVIGLLNELKSRQKLRQQWDERRADKIYQRRVNVSFRPVARPVFEDGGANTQEGNRLPKDLSSAIRELSALLSKYSRSSNASTDRDIAPKQMKNFSSSKTNMPSTNQHPKKKKRRLDSSGPGKISKQIPVLTNVSTKSDQDHPTIPKRPIEPPATNSQKKKKRKKKKSNVASSQAIVS